MSIFRKPVEKILVSLQSKTTTTGTLHEHQYIHFWSYLVQFFLEWEMFQTKFVQRIKTHVLCSVNYFRKECRLWNNMDRARPQMTMWLMRSACWIRKATNTHSEYVTIIAFSTDTTDGRTGLDITLNTHCLSRCQLLSNEYKIQG